jgi:hypothetical protein
LSDDFYIPNVYTSTKFQLASLDDVLIGLGATARVGNRGFLAMFLTCSGLPTRLGGDLTSDKI